MRNLIERFGRKREFIKKKFMKISVKVTNLLPSSEQHPEDSLLRRLIPILLLFFFIPHNVYSTLSQKQNRLFEEEKYMSLFPLKFIEKKNKITTNK